MRVHAESEGGERVQHLGLALNPARWIDRIHEGLQPARGSDRWMELAHGAGCRVARVGVSRLAGLFEARVGCGERALGQVDLAADLELIGEAFHLCQRHGHRADGADVGGHVLALDAVATRRRAHEASTCVGDRHRQSVDLQLTDVAADLADRALDPNAEVAHLVGAEGVVQAEHRGAVPDLGEGRRGLTADALRWRIGGLELGVRRFEIDKLAEEVVVLGVGDLRCVEDVVLTRVMLEFPVQRENSVAGVLESHCRSLGIGRLGIHGVASAPRWARASHRRPRRS